MYDYNWESFGLLIKTPAGTCFLQGEEADVLYDTLENAETDQDVENILSDYETVCEPY